MIQLFFSKSNHSSTITSVIVSLLLLLAVHASAQTGCPPTIRDCKTAQEMLSLAYTADLSSGLEGSIGPITATTTKRINCLLPVASALNNNWDLVWGPVIVLKQYTASGLCGSLFPPPKNPTPANTMFVAKKRGANIFTVAIAGTNPSSAYGWCVEDEDITPVAWPFSLHAGYVNQGTNDGLNILKSMLQPVAPRSLLEFLAFIARYPQTTVYVSGHSLGGALAPAFALWLKNRQRSWDPAGNVTLIIYAYAGATPGDKVFAAYINGQFTGPTLNVINDTLDVVPHAWNITTLDQLRGLYSGVGISPGFKLDFAIHEAKKNNTTTIQTFKKTHPNYPFAYGRTGSATQQQSFTGTLIVPPYWPFSSCPSLTEIKNKFNNNYALEAAYQHGCSYPDKLSLPNLNAKGSQCRKAFPVVGTYKP